TDEALPDVRRARVGCLAECAKQLISAGRRAAVDPLVAAIEDARPDAGELDALTEAVLSSLYATRDLYDDNLVAAHDHPVRACAWPGCERAGGERSAARSRAPRGFTLSGRGAPPGAGGVPPAAHPHAERLELPNVVAAVTRTLGLVLPYRGRLDEARRFEERA